MVRARGTIAGCSGSSLVGTHAIEPATQSDGRGPHQEPRMSSTHEPPQLLEPSNLLEPLDLNQHGDFADPSACGERGERGERGPRTQPQFTRGKPRVPR